MLYQLGPLAIKTYPISVDRVKTETTSAYAQKPYLLSAPGHEYVGENSPVKTWSATLFPYKLGGLDELALLQLMRQSALPYPLMSGNYDFHGWWVILSASLDEDHLSPRGIGQQIKVQITLNKTAAPDAFGLASIAEQISHARGSLRALRGAF